VQNIPGKISKSTQTQTMFNNTLQTPRCSYVRQVSGVHTFVFQEASRAAVDQWIDYMDDILGTSSLERILGISLDTRQSGAMPLAYMTQRLRDLFSNYDKRPSIRIALISNQGALMLLIQMLAQITASDDQNVVQYYQASDDDDAARWLLETN
jgi:hypothetical protein